MAKPLGHLTENRIRFKDFLDQFHLISQSTQIPRISIGNYSLLLSWNYFRQHLQLQKLFEHQLCDRIYVILKDYHAFSSPQKNVVAGRGKIEGFALSNLYRSDGFKIDIISNHFDGHVLI